MTAYRRGKPNGATYEGRLAEDLDKRRAYRKKCADDAEAYWKSPEGCAEAERRNIATTGRNRTAPPPAPPEPRPDIERAITDLRAAVREGRMPRWEDWVRRRKPRPEGTLF